MSVVLAALAWMAALLCALLAVAIWDDVHRPLIRHPYRDDIPSSWD